MLTLCHFFLVARGVVIWMLCVPLVMNARRVGRRGLQLLEFPPVCFAMSLMRQNLLRSLVAHVQSGPTPRTRPPSKRATNAIDDEKSANFVRTCVSGGLPETVNTAFLLILSFLSHEGLRTV